MGWKIRRCKIWLARQDGRRSGTGVWSLDKVFEEEILDSVSSYTVYLFVIFSGVFA